MQLIGACGVVNRYWSEKDGTEESASVGGVGGESGIEGGGIWGSGSTTGRSGSLGVGVMTTGSTTGKTGSWF